MIISHARLTRLISIALLAALGCFPAPMVNRKPAPTQQRSLPKLELTVRKQLVSPCLSFVLTNTRPTVLDEVRVGFLVLDSDQNTLDGRNIYFNPTLPGKKNTQILDLLDEKCDRAVTVSLTDNAHLFTQSVFTIGGEAAETEPGRIILEMKTLSHRAVYLNSDFENHVYQQSEKLTESETVITGRWADDSINQRKSERDVKVLGIDRKGHSSLTLAHAGGKLYVIRDLKVEDDSSPEKAGIVIHYRAEAEFVVGSWDAYEAGEQVEIRLTDAGKKVANEQATMNLRKFYHRAFSKTLAADHPGLNVEVTRQEPDRRGRFVADLQRIEYEGPRETLVVIVSEAG